MNEKLRTLAGKALDEAVPETWTTLTAYDLDKFTNVLAELIVNECCDWIDKSPSTESGQLLLSKSFIIANLKGYLGGSK